MSWWEFAGIVIVGLIIWQAVAYFMGSPKFWRLAGRNPDVAYAIFCVEPSCIVDQAPPAERRSDYTGPFRFMTSNGVTHNVYILYDALNELQARMTPILIGAETRLRQDNSRSAR